MTGISTPSPGRWERLAPYAVATVIALIALTRYVGTLAPSIVGDDSAELEVLAWKLGVPHGTSYPLYVWLGHLFMSLPIGDDVAYRLNLFSAVCGAAAVFLVFLVTFELDGARTLGARCVGAGVAAALVARSHTFWEIAVFTGEYTLHVLLALVAILLLLRWMRLGSRGYLIGAFATLGAMFGNHALTVALLPGAAVFVFLRGRPSRALGETVALGLLAGAAALLFCNVFLFYLLWRRALPFDHWQWVLCCPRFFDLPPDARGRFWYAWWYEVTCRQFQHELTGAPLALRLAQIRAVPFRLAGELFPIGALLALGGWVLGWRRWRENLLLTLIWVAHVHLVSSLDVTLKSHVYLLVATALGGVYAGLAVSWLAETFATNLVGPGAMPERARNAALVCALVSTFVLGVLDERARVAYRASVAQDKALFAQGGILAALGDRPDARGFTMVHTAARHAVDALPPDAIVLTRWELHYAIEHVARIERGIETLTVLETYPFGVGRRQLPVDYLDWIRDPGRTRRIFFVDVHPPTIEGFTVVRRTEIVAELVRGGGA
jgi:Protein of unknown function (DUF2723)